MKTVEERAQKYADKVVGDVMKNRIDAQKDVMVANYTSACLNLAQVDQIVREIVKTKNVPKMLISMYMAFARHVDKLYRKFEGDALKGELDITFMTWTKRGLKRNLLVKIRNELKEFRDG